MRSIAVVNQKGGCGKTTVSINLASALAEAGKRVLLVDMDPQSHCAVGLAVPEEQIEQSIYDVLISRSRNEPIRLTEMLWQISDKLELAPASIDLSAFEQQMAGIGERDCCLKMVLDQVKGEYDYSIIDCPPAVGLLTFNALIAATDVIVPVETGYFALHGLSKQLETLKILCDRCSQRVDVKVLASMYDIRTKMAREILSELRGHFADKMFKTVVNFNTKIKEASSFGQPVGEYDPASKGHKDFKALAEEVIGAEAKQQRHQMVNSLSEQLESISISAEELLKATKPEVKTVPVTFAEPLRRAPRREPVEIGSQMSAPTRQAKAEQPHFADLSAGALAKAEQRVTACEPASPQRVERAYTAAAPSFQKTEAGAASILLSSPAEGGAIVKDEKPGTVKTQPASTVKPVVISPATAPKETSPVTVSAFAKASSFANAPSFANATEDRTEDRTADKSTFAKTSAKLSDYYGVNQIDDAIVFVTLYPRASNVQVAGDFNNWQPTKTPFEKVGESGVWQTKIKLPQGKYRYRLVVDGQWQQDPYNEQTELNPFGDFNSVLEVK